MLETALADDDAHAARVAACVALSGVVSQTGRAFWTAAYVMRDQRLEGLALLTEMAGELASGAVSLFRGERWYAGAALVRQLVEAEYLMHLFSIDPAEPARWLNASAAELRREFQPKKMRVRSGGRFRDSEYWTHCELGGHPHPHGRILLHDHTPPLGSHRGGWADLGQHLEGLWRSLGSVAQLQGAQALIPEKLAREASEALAFWHARDPLSRRIPLRDSGDTESISAPAI